MEPVELVGLLVYSRAASAYDHVVVVPTAATPTIALWRACTGGTFDIHDLEPEDVAGSVIDGKAKVTLLGYGGKDNDAVQGDSWTKELLFELVWGVKEQIEKVFRLFRAREQNGCQERKHSTAENLPHDGRAKESGSKGRKFAP